MEATGIACHMDDLGRLTIPATIRKKMKIKDGERFEISIDEEEEIISFKRNPINFNK